MALSKTKAKLFEKDQIQLAGMAKALGHPARIAILEFLAECDTCICGEISSHLPLAQSPVSQHLKALKEAGFIQGRIDGVRSCYCLDKKKLAEYRALVESLFHDLLDANGTKHLQ
jgi:ArsR family transcriptional regulator